MIRKHSAIVHKFVNPETNEVRYFVEFAGRTFHSGNSNSQVSVGRFKEACGFYRQSITELVQEYMFGYTSVKDRISHHQGWRHTKFIKHWTTDWDHIGGV